jgi:hypothetical protein
MGHKKHKDYMTIPNFKFMAYRLEAHIKKKSIG